VLLISNALNEMKIEIFNKIFYPNAIFSLRYKWIQFNVRTLEEG